MSGPEGIPKQSTPTTQGFGSVGGIYKRPEPMSSGVTGPARTSSISGAGHIIRPDVQAKPILPNTNPILPHSHDPNVTTVSQHAEHLADDHAVHRGSPHQQREDVADIATNKLGTNAEAGVNNKDKLSDELKNQNLISRPVLTSVSRQPTSGLVRPTSPSVPNLVRIPLRLQPMKTRTESSPSQTNSTSTPTKAENSAPTNEVEVKSTETKPSEAKSTAKPIEAKPTELNEAKSTKDAQSTGGAKPLEPKSMKASEASNKLYRELQTSKKAIENNYKAVFMAKMVGNIDLANEMHGLVIKETTKLFNNLNDYASNNYNSNYKYDSKLSDTIQDNVYLAVVNEGTMENIFGDSELINGMNRAFENVPQSPIRQELLSTINLIQDNEKLIQKAEDTQKKTNEAITTAIPTTKEKKGGFKLFGK